MCEFLYFAEGIITGHEIKGDLIINVLLRHWTEPPLVLFQSLHQTFGTWLQIFSPIQPQETRRGQTLLLGDEVWLTVSAPVHPEDVALGRGQGVCARQAVNTTASWTGPHQPVGATASLYIVIIACGQKFVDTVLEYIHALLSCSPFLI